MFNVLLVEDDPEALAGVETLLAMAGHRVQRAGNGREAFIAASNDMPDIIVSDVVMPVMDGIRLVRALREAPMLVHIP
jgi:CheY-like chemotaxis protein